MRYADDDPDFLRHNSGVLRARRAYYTRPANSFTKSQVGREERATAVRAYLSGRASLIELGALLNVHPDTVGNWVRNAKRECC